MSGLARLKPGSARALLKRELECCSDRPEKANCQPGLFGRACLEKQRRRSGVGVGVVVVGGVVVANVGPACLEGHV